MRLTPITATAGLLLTLTLTACSSSEEPATKPAPTTTTASPTTTADAEAAAQACSNAVYNTILNTPTTDATSLPKPPECATISDADYLETVLAVVQQQNKDGQDALRKAIEDAATPTP